MADKNVYLNEVLKQIPRLLGLMNRNKLSKTYGCLDRQYWQYNVTDTPSARCQEAVLALALLYKTKGTEYYGNKQVLEWINAGIDFWTKIQRKNGSFNEWYPIENSFVATAFSSYAISETILTLKGRIKDEDKVILCLKKAGDWLLNKKEKRAQNQQAGAVIALYNIFLLTGDKKYKQSAELKIKNMVDSQTKEGWFYEYGGADIGYLSLAIDYVSKYFKKSKDKKAEGILNKGLDFISYFIHPNLSFGGEYGSRNTEYLIPSGFELLAKENKDAEVISSFIREALKKKTSISPSCLDDRYLTYIAYNWLQAYISAGRLKRRKARFENIFIKNFQSAKIYIFSDKDIYLIANYGKGGSFKLFFKRSGRVVYDSGILAQAKNHLALTSGSLSDLNRTKIMKGKLIISGRMSRIKDKALSPINCVLLRIFQMTIGRSQMIGSLVKEKLRDKLVTKKKYSKIRFKREISISERKVTDIIEGKGIKSVVAGSKQSYEYTPSSRYFQRSELSNEPVIVKNRKKAKKIIISRTYENSKLIKKVDFF